MAGADGRVGDSGEIIEIEQYRRLVLSWRNEFRPELHAEGYSRVTYVLEPQGDMVKLTLTHEIDRPGSKLIEAVAPTSEAIYAEITSRYGARKLAELQDMLGALERSLGAMEVAGDDSGETDE